jgi:uncharacterized protein
MIIDVNAALGHYPFRALRYHTANAMVGLMDRHGIGQAVVSSLHAVFYRDVHRGNAELREEIRAHGRRFIPVATINPKYAGWQRDFEEAIGPWGMKAVALAPEHHSYALTDVHGRAALRLIEERGLPVVLTQRLEDRRQRHASDQAEDLTPQALIEAAKAHPRLKFLLVNWAGLNGAALAAAGLRGRCLIDLARFSVVLRKEVDRLIDTLGVEAVAFGTHLPFDYVGPSLVKLANLEQLRPADAPKIAAGNARAFLGLE